MNGSYAKVLLAFIISLTGILLYNTLTHGHDWGGDFSAYIMQAQSVAEGSLCEFIKANRFTIQQSLSSLGPVVYPWGFPVMLSPFYAVFGLNMIALKMVGVISYLIFLLLLWIGFRKYHSYLWLYSLVCLFSLNPFLLKFLNNILSDIPFMLFSTFTILFIGKLFVEGKRIISPACDSILLGVSIAAAFFIRSNGILLLVTLSITQFIAIAHRLSQVETVNDSWSSTIKSFFSPSRTTIQNICINLLPYFSFLGVLLLWRAFLPEGGSYHMDHLGMISVYNIKPHLRFYFELPSEFFTGVPFRNLLYGVSIPCAIVGLSRRFRHDYHIVVYLILTFSLYIFWPAIQGFRFLFPVLPFYYSFVLSGLETFQGGANAIERALRRLICLLPIVIVLSYFGMNTISGAYKNIIDNRESSSGPFTTISTNMFSFIEQNTEAESTVIFFKPRVMRMLTGRRSLMTNKMKELSRGDYLCLYLKGGTYDQVTPDAIIRLSEEGAARLIYENSEFRVYRLTEGT